jgi:hypothetical protein
LNASGTADELKAFADSAMAEYDLNGWTASDLINPTEVNVIKRGWIAQLAGKPKDILREF